MPFKILPFCAAINYQSIDDEYYTINDYNHPNEPECNSQSSGCSKEYVDSIGNVKWMFNIQKIRQNFLKKDKIFDNNYENK